jgi:hypothetical protein
VSLRRLTFALAAFAGCAPAVHADLQNCANISANPTDFKVVLDDLALATAATPNADISDLNVRLRFNFMGEIDALKRSAVAINRDLKVPLRLVFCQGRQPSLTGDEFSDELARRLAGDKVVLEMWGQVGVSAVANGAPSALATIGYTLPPVQTFVDRAAAPPLLFMRYPKTGANIAIQDLESLPELKIVVLVGLGTQAVRGNRYDLAVWAFERADALFRAAKLASVNTELDQLSAYARLKACETRNAARQDPGYMGSLKVSALENCRDAQ